MSGICEMKSNGEEKAKAVASQVKVQVQVEVQEDKGERRKILVGKREVEIFERDYRELVKFERETGGKYKVSQLLKKARVSGGVVEAIDWVGGINVKGTDITSFPVLLSGIKRLDCSHCLSLTCLPDKMSGLENLWCNGCTSLTHLPEGMNNLNRLECGGCQGVIIPEGLTRCEVYPFRITDEYMYLDSARRRLIVRYDYILKDFVNILHYKKGLVSWNSVSVWLVPGGMSNTCFQIEKFERELDLKNDYRLKNRRAILLTELAIHKEIILLMIGIAHNRGYWDEKKTDMTIMMFQEFEKLFEKMSYGGEAFGLIKALLGKNLASN